MAGSTQTEYSLPLLPFSTHGIRHLGRCWLVLGGLLYDLCSVTFGIHACITGPHPGEQELPNDLIVGFLDFYDCRIEVPVVIQGAPRRFRRLPLSFRSHPQRSCLPERRWREEVPQPRD